jgi:hypothetical protein
MTDKKVMVHRRRPIASGIIYLGLGIYLLLLMRNDVPPIEDSWPILLVIFGLALIVGALVRRREPSGPSEQHQSQ